MDTCYSSLSNIYSKSCVLFFLVDLYSQGRIPSHPHQQEGEHTTTHLATSPSQRKRKKQYVFKSALHTPRYSSFSFPMSKSIYCFFCCFCRLWVLYVQSSDPVHIHTLGWTRNVTTIFPPLMDNLFLTSPGPPLTSIQPHLAWRRPNGPWQLPLHQELSRIRCWRSTPYALFKQLCYSKVAF